MGILPFVSQMGLSEGLCKHLREQVSQDSNLCLPSCCPRERLPRLSGRNHRDCKTARLGSFLLEKPGLSFDKIDLIAAWFCLAVALKGDLFSP